MALRVLVACFAVALSGVLGTLSVAAQGAPPPVVSLPKQTYVIGRDTEIPVSGQLGASCAGTSVQAALYTRGPAAPNNTVDEVLAPASATVAADGSFRASIKLPPALPSGLRTGPIGVAGPCLKAPVFFLAGPVMLAVADAADNAGVAGTFIIPGSILNSTANTAGGETIGKTLGTVSVFADGVLCASIPVASGPALDSAGSAHLHVGGAEQPAACSREGATITFVNGNGQTLVEKRTLIIGVSQPLANIGVEPPGTGGSAMLLAPTGLAISYSGGQLPADGIPRAPGIAGSIQVTLSWRAGAPEDERFDVERGLLDAAGAMAFASIGTTNTGAGADGRYSFDDPKVGILGGPCYRVRAVNATGSGPYSETVCVPRAPSSGPVQPAPGAPGTGTGVGPVMAGDTWSVSALLATALAAFGIAGAAAMLWARRRGGSS
jgi:hypothetical protein